MPYDPVLVQPMREELSTVGVQELLTANDVDAFMEAREGTALLIINSVCGCAAGSARPGIRLALTHDKTPDRVATVFAGQDLDATERARSYFSEYPPSSPSFALFAAGELVYFHPRHRIEARPPQQIAAELASIFDRFCA